jgi:hypothetical protein
MHFLKYVFYDDDDFTVLFWSAEEGRNSFVSFLILTVNLPIKVLY